jgi:hypothetical protein
VNTTVTNKARCRRIELESPLEVFDLSTVYLPFPHTYRVRAVVIHSTGVLDGEIFDFLGNRIPRGALTRQIAGEAVKVLGMGGEICRSPRSKARRRPGRSPMIPDVWGLTFRAVS